MKTHTQSILIGEKEVGEQHPCFFIAEAGLSHDGSLGTAHAFIDAAADIGADAVKFQTHLAEHESSPEEKFRTAVFLQDKTRYDYWKRTAFSELQWAGLKKHADSRNIIFLSSPFSLEAMKLLKKLGVPAWKIGSGETNNIPLLVEMVKTKLPFLLSTGMSYLTEIDNAVELITDNKSPLILYQCTNRYPCPPEHLGLNMIQEFKNRYQVPVGFSDHSGKVAAGIAAFVSGACSIEVHVTFHQQCFGPDTPASLTFEELKELIAGIRFLEKALSHPIDKNQEAEYLKDIRLLFNKSIITKRTIKAGTKITLEDIDFKKPGNGIPASDYLAIIGKTAKTDIKISTFISWKDVSDE